MDMGIDYYSMFMLGFIGTGHCIGMCGPLIVAIPGQSGQIKAHLLYHCGRLLTYTVIGLLMGITGTSLKWLASGLGADPLQWVAWAQIGISVVAAFFLLYLGITRIGFFEEPSWMSLASPEKLPGFGKTLKSALSNQHRTTYFLLGLMLGLLPCGLTFGAFARALAAAEPWKGAGFLLAFGLGTLPGLLMLGAGVHQFATRYRKQSDILAGMLMIAMGIKLILNTVFS
jgi:sulfite exporter TauE/SafE